MEVTVTTTSVEQDTTGEKAISYYEMSKNYYVKTGNMPQLPSTVKAVYTDGSEKEIPVLPKSLLLSLKKFPDLLHWLLL